jgi:hypothetical protein
LASHDLPDIKTRLDWNLQTLKSTLIKLILAHQSRQGIEYHRMKDFDLIGSRNFTTHVSTDPGQLSRNSAVVLMRTWT